MTEHWKPVVGYEGYYEVSDLGRVKRVSSIGRNTYAGRLLTIVHKANGYCQVDLCKNSVRSCKSVHRLVLEAFVCPCLPGSQCNHKNGDKADNRLENLEWVTPWQNTHHAIEELDVWPSHPPPLHVGSDVHTAKLTEEQVKEIRSLYATGRYTQSELGQSFGVNKEQINRIINRKAWKHVA